MKTCSHWKRPALAAACAGWLVALGCAHAGQPASAVQQRVLAVCADPANLPYSDDQLQGFENRLAELLAADLNATVRYTWNMQRRSFLRRTLHAGACDVVLGLPSGLQGVLQTRPYYTSSYVFVTASQRGLKLTGLDDPALRELRIGLQAVGAEGSNTPPAMALAKRGIVQRVTGFPMWGVESDTTPQAHIIEAVANGEVDVAIVWGPFAGYFAARQKQPLEVTPISFDATQPALPFSYSMALGVRRGDEGLRNELQLALDRHAPEIQALLKRYGIPLVEPTAGEQHAATNTATQP